MGPSTSSSTGRTIINGKVTSETSKTFTYIVVAKNEGVVNIPAATIKVDGKTYSSNALTVKVLPQDKASEAQQGSGNNQNANGLGSNDVLCRLVLSKTKAYEGEAVLASIKLLTTNPQTQIQDAKFPSFDGFTVQEIDLPQQKSFDMEHVDGKNYYSVVLKQYLLYPQRSGKIEIAPAMLEVVVPVRTERRMRSIFDDFFDNYENISKTIYSSKLAVDATALPDRKSVV